jgi:hypothetical protein
VGIVSVAVVAHRLHWGTSENIGAVRSRESTEILAQFFDSDFANG